MPPMPPMLPLGIEDQSACVARAPWLGGAAASDGAEPAKPMAGPADAANPAGRAARGGAKPAAEAAKPPATGSMRLRFAACSSAPSCAAAPEESAARPTPAAAAATAAAAAAGEPQLPEPSLTMLRREEAESATPLGSWDGSMTGRRLVQKL